ncbi:MAG TPA: sugar kinase [Candidatus Binatia bacterium]|nr:sugar kinase [Candidatus Binatia bacterium]
MPRFDVTIAGELNLDLILYGLPEELPPERELLADNMMLTLGSSSAIVAHNLAALGMRVGFISKIGDDPLGQIALERLRAGGVDVSRVKTISGPVKTGLTTILQRRTWRNMLTYPGTIFDLKMEDLDLDYLADSRHFHLSSFYLQRGLQERVPELFRRMKSLGLTISLDTNDDPDDAWLGGLNEALGLVDVFLPNAREARRISGLADLAEAMNRIAEKVPLVVVKAGMEGAMAQRGKEKFSAPAFQVDAVDAVGAGDSFDAGFLSEYLRGSDLPACLRMGNVAGALSVTRPGGTEAFRDREYVTEFVRARRAG